MKSAVEATMEATGQIASLLKGLFAKDQRVEGVLVTKEKERGFSVKLGCCTLDDWVVEESVNTI